MAPIQPQNKAARTTNQNIPNNTTPSNPISRMSHKTFMFNRCDPCRQLKHKCPGEKPACARCVRLGKNCVYPTANPRDARASTPKRLSGAGARRSEMDSLPGSEAGTNQHELTDNTPNEKQDNEGDIEMEMGSGTETGDVIVVRTSSPNVVGTGTSQKRHRGRPVSSTLKTQPMRPNPQQAESKPSKHVMFDPDERQLLIAEEARKALEITEAMAQVRKTTGGPSEVRAVGFGDIDTRRWPPDIRNEWQAIAGKVLGEINLGEGQVEWDVSGTKRGELRETILQVTALAKARSEYPEFQMALTRLLASLRLCHDFFETLGASMTTANELKWAIERPQFQK
ncbi:hypothetical protein K491DRAFT_89425 [Lophiostoma macrostomum CBS 122681]|uniref:Zn(2)-C6 fungal-type domain-containing protein n=1 Tax=Lophiostoma macrostomum CBS 122681 TaxID=1314788 RepID=A0A6A6SY54_9PLEO|nr:hypothetical protein K491DRAFT_89425 [Lophiostoma macrostomum CBS 122681]